MAIPCNRYLGGDGLEYCHYDSPYGCFCGDVDTDPNSDTYGQGIPLETSTIIYPGNCRYTESPLCQWCIDWCAFDGAELNPGVSIGDCRIPSPYVNTNDRCVDIWNECFENGGNEEICGADPIDDCFYNNVSIRTDKEECERINEGLGNLDSWDIENLFYHRCSEEEPHVGGPHPMEACTTQCFEDNDPANGNYWIFDSYRDLGLVDPVTGEWFVNTGNNGCHTSDVSVRTNCCMVQCNDYINHPI